MTYNAAEYRAARQELWKLIDEHPELDELVSLGSLLADHRHYTLEASPHYWRTDWQGVLQEVQAAVRLVQRR